MVGTKAIALARRAPGGDRRAQFGDARATMRMRSVRLVGAGKLPSRTAAT